jgi:hypothetical protein
MTNELKTIHTGLNDENTYRASKRVMFGIALVLIGSLFLFERLGYIANHSAGHYWVLLLCVFGLNALLFSPYADRKIKGGLQIFLGFWVFACLEHLWGWTFLVTWPMILIALGLCYIGSFLIKSTDTDNGNRHE